jgi:predicted phage baseplate assembly protein
MREYLNMIGVTLTPPSSAKAFCFFRTTTKPTFDVTVLKGFEVSTSGAGGEKPVVFTTDEDLVIHAARLKKFVADQGGTLADFTADARDPATVFSPLPAVAIGDAIYLGYDEDNYFEKLIVDVATPAAAVSGAWEFLEAQPDGTGSWEPLDVEDGTLGFTQSGAVTFQVPARWDATSIAGVRATWLRYRITSIEPGGVFASLRKLDIDQIVGRVSCSNAVTVPEEILGASDGAPDQRYFLSKVPVLDLTVVVDEGAGFQEWSEVEDFSASGAADRHYLVNCGTGEILFGDGRHGKVPAKGTGNVRARPYRFGGGIKGNVGAGTIIQLRQTHPFIASVTNKETASGGGNEETIQEAMRRGPAEVLRTRNRAVVAEDFETLTLESSTGIARAKTLPLFDPTEPATPKPGLVSVIVLAKGGAPLSLALRDQVRGYLDARRLVTTQIFVVDTAFVPVDLTVTVVKTPEANAVELEATIRAVIQEYYGPEFGGDPARAVNYVAGISSERGNGWEFGRDVFRSELFELLERVGGVDHVESIAVPAATVSIEDFQLPRVEDVIVNVAA